MALAIFSWKEFQIFHLVLIFTTFLLLQEMDPMKLSEIYLRFGYLFMSVRFAKSHLESNITKIQLGNPSENQNLYTNPKLFMTLFSVLRKRDDAESRIAHEELKQLWDSYLERLEC